MTRVTARLPPDTVDKPETASKKVLVGEAAKHPPVKSGRAYAAASSLCILAHVGKREARTDCAMATYTIGPPRVFEFAPLGGDFISPEAPA